MSTLDVLGELEAPVFQTIEDLPTIVEDFQQALEASHKEPT
jgi:hypothetical protein